MKNKINTFDDVLKYHGITAEEFEKQTEGLQPDTKAYEQLKLIVSAYNRNEKPDFTNSDQRKYEPWFRYSSASGGFVSTTALTTGRLRLSALGFAI